MLRFLPLVLLCLLATAEAQESSDPSANYRPKPIVSLIVNGKDNRHALTALDKLIQLKERKNVKIGNVFVVGFSSLKGIIPEGRQLPQGANAEALLQSLSHQGQRISITKRAADAGVPHYELVRTEEVLDGLKVQNSPTWIVRHLGQDYIFEGFLDPSKLFSNDGSFVAGN